jgi:hypothetical protein
MAWSTLLPLPECERAAISPEVCVKEYVSVILFDALEKTAFLAIGLATVRKLD